ncbi:MAG: RNA polymerase sigma factor [Chloroflexota bacterium]
MFARAETTDAEQLYRRYRGAVYAYLVRLTGDGDWAQELLQETFYRAIVRASSYRGDAAPLSWLCAIARNLFAGELKRRQRERRSFVPVDDEQPASPDDSPDRELLRREQRAMIDRIIAGLPETQRLALLLRDFDGLPYESIGEILGLTLANVKVTIHRARVRFREAYAAERSGSDD